MPPENLTIGDYELKFLDGPAADERPIRLSICPEGDRWFCEKKHGDKKMTWWRVDGEPPEDKKVKVTRYSIAGSAPRRDGSYLITYAVAEEE